MLNPITSLTLTELKRLVALKEQIEELTSELNSLGKSSPSTPPVARRRKRRMSAATRAKLSVRAKARWAKIRSKGGAKKAVRSTRGKKRTMSAATKAKLAAVARARWAKVKARGKSKL